jgi:hypothetical protein
MAQLPEINTLLEQARKGLEAAERAERAGIDLGDAEGRFRQAITQLTAIKEQYFPGEQ